MTCKYRPRVITFSDRTWDVDQHEGTLVNDLIATSQNRIHIPSIEVPEDPLKGNIVVTSVDALVNWSRNLHYGLYRSD
ncbi:MAG: hypothetical protein CM1200mP15_12960 [Dehalococcoidia bacterium]|nr:MAG: hypothetical protein CM1200mP15_12960 [Dehalococcoidia bacterium]